MAFIDAHAYLLFVLRLSSHLQYFFCTLFCLTQYPIDVAIVSSLEEQFYFFLLCFSLGLWRWAVAGCWPTSTSGQFSVGSVLGDWWGRSLKVGPRCGVEKLTVRVFLLKIDSRTDSCFYAGRILAASLSKKTTTARF